MAFQCSILQAQHPLYYPINEEHGLPTDEIYEIAQDHFGLIWVASNSGLFSYDGIRVRRYSHPQEKTSATTAVMLDAQDHVWCHNTAGQVFKLVGDSLQMMLDPVPESPLRAFVFDPAGGFCALANDKALRYDARGALRDSFLLSPEIPLTAKVLDATMRGDKLFLFVSKIGAFELDFATKHEQLCFHSDILSTGGFNFKGTDLYLFMIDQQDQSKEILRYGSGIFERIYATTAGEESDRWLRIVPGAGHDRLWVCTGNGAFSLQAGKNGWHKGPKRFPGTPISSVLEDHEGIEWFSTLSEGFLVVPSPEIAGLVTTDGDARQNNFTAIAALDDGSLICGSYFGKVFKIDTLANVIQEIFVDQDNEGQFQVRKILQTDAKILIGRGVISSIDLPHKRLQRFPRFFHARDIAIAGHELYLVLPAISYRFSYQGALVSDEILWETIHPQGGRAVEVDSLRGDVYFAFNDGTYLEHLGHREELLLNGEKIFASLLCASDEGMWVAVPKTGLLLFRGGKLVRALGLQDGLPSIGIRALFAAHDVLFFATEGHLCALDLKTNAITTLSASVGFNPHHIQQMAVSNGRLWLATTKGIVALPLPLHDYRALAPPIRICQVLLDHKPIDFGKGLRITDRNSDLRIVFEGISFRSRSRFHFEYRIPRIDSAWTVTPAAANFVNYASLQPGRFDFEVRAVDENGICSDVPATLHFEVATPFQQQPWFFVLIGCTLLLISYAIFHVRLRYLRRRHRIKEQLIHSQLTALKAQMNPHFMFNALNSIQDFVISKDVRNSNLYLTKFSTLMRKVLDASGQEQVLLSDEIEMLRLYLDLEQLRFGADMQYEIHCDTNVDVHGISIPSMIIQPFVENAIKHGLLHKRGEKRLSIQFGGGKELLCAIRDNGVGRKRSAEIKQRGAGHVSFSTAATVKRLDLIQALHGAAVSLTITDLEENGEASGTLVELKLPIMNPSEPLVN